MILFLKDFLLDFPPDWNEKITIFRIFFTIGLLCIVCAILLAFYLLESDKFTSQPEKEEILSYTSSVELEEESRLSLLKSKIGAFFGRIKRAFKRSKEDSEFLKDNSIKTTKNFPFDLPEEETNSTNKDSPQ